MYSITAGVVSIVRNCAEQGDVGCKSSHVGDVETNICICKTDKCNDGTHGSDTGNGSESIVSSTFNLIVVAVAVIVNAILI